MIGDVAEGAGGLRSWTSVTTLPAVVREARDVRGFGCVVDFFLGGII